MMRTSKALLAAAAVLALAACDNSATGTDSGRANIRVAATGDGNGPNAQVAPAPSGTDAPRYGTTTADGTITFSARVYVQTQAGGWVELTNGAAQQATVDAAGRTTSAAFASSSVDAGTYTRVRVVFSDVHGSLNGSLQVSNGLLTGSVYVGSQSGSTVTVERQVSVAASAGGTTTLLLDLNSSAWLDHASATTHAVSEADFASAVSVAAE